MVWIFGKVCIESSFQTDFEILKFSTLIDDKSIAYTYVVGYSL